MIKISFDVFENYCKNCEFYEFNNCSYRHYCHASKIFEPCFFNIRDRIKVVGKKENKSVKCKWLEIKEETDLSISYEVNVFDNDNCINRTYLVAIKNKTNMDEVRKLKDFAHGLKLAYPDFNYNDENLSKELIEGFLKGKMIKKG